MDRPGLHPHTAVLLVLRENDPGGHVKSMQNKDAVKHVMIALLLKGTYHGGASVKIFKRYGFTKAPMGVLKF